MSETTRDLLLSTGTDVISQYGYHASGLDLILKTAGVPKGSFYHYFKSKEDFGLAVIDMFGRQFREKLEAILLNSTEPPVERLRTFFKTGKQDLIDADFEKGCLAGNLGQELADQNEHFRVRIQEIFVSWQNVFETCLKQAAAAGELSAVSDTATMAVFLLSGWEGAILYAKVAKSAAPLDAFMSTAEKLLSVK
jgi:Transcriptional regulator